MLLPYAVTLGCYLKFVALCCCLVLYQHFDAVTLLCCPTAVTWHAMQAQQLATELVTIVKQLIELNVKARKLKVRPKNVFP